MNPLARIFVKGHVLLYQLSGGKLGTTMRGSPIMILIPIVELTPAFT